MSNTPDTAGEDTYDVAIIGGGVAGTSLLYTLSEYTDIDDIALLEQYDDIAPLNSDSASNSQTLHAGDIETNYSRAKSEKVKEAADRVIAYADSQDRDDITHNLSKMVLGVGEDEVQQLEQRYDDLEDLYPELERLDREEIAEHEPALVEGRDDDTELLALQSDDGYAVDFGALAESFTDSARQADTSIDLELGTGVEALEETGDGYRIDTDEGYMTADAVAVTAGTNSLDFAQELGYGDRYRQLPVAGGFYWGPDDLELDSKVYTVQNEKLPFAAVHGDPDIDEDGRVRFGPTALPLGSHEWTQTGAPDFVHPDNIDLATLKDLADTDVLKTLGDTLFDREVAGFMAKNMLFQTPRIGTKAFLRDAQKVVPSLEEDDIAFAEGKGGVRPQIIDREANELVLGEAKIYGDDILFNMTPSPGASNCLANAEDDTQYLADKLGADFEQDRFQDDLSRD